jgi:predicted negative regulator of RcsB-dependent stress response
MLDPVEGGRLVETPDRLPFATLFRAETKATLDPKGPLRAHVTLTVRGDAEVFMRAGALAVASLTPERRRDFAKALAAEWDKGEADNLTTSEATRTDEPLRLEYDVVHEMGASVFAKSWDLWFPLPDFNLPEAGKSSGPEETAVKLELPDETVARGECRMPTGMKARAPLAISLDRPFASFRSTYAVEAGVMRVERTLHVHAREVLGKDAADYEAFRKAIDQDHSQKFPVEAWTDGSEPAQATAADLHAQAYKALDQGKAKEAEELFRKVTALEPRHPYAFNNLGRALRQQGRTDEALAAFEKQIEVSPFDEYAWANRGDMLLREGKQEEAERCFERQIEVAPVRPWAYRSLGGLRASQKRYRESVELLTRATSAEPSHAPTWLQLAWVSFLDGRAEEGRAAADKARTLDTSPFMQLAAASTLTLGPYKAEAGAWAEAAAPRLAEALDRLDAARMTPADQALTAMLAECWRLRGTASLEAGRDEDAERFLGPAWEWGLFPDAAVALARLREKQGRAASANRILARGAAIHGWPENPARKALEKAVPDPTAREPLLDRGRAELLKARTRPLAGPPAGAVALDVLLFVDASGRVADVSLVAPGMEKTLARVKPRVAGLDLGLAWADGSAHPHVRRASIGCSTASPCALVLDLLDRQTPVPMP